MDRGKATIKTDILSDDLCHFLLPAKQVVSGDYYCVTKNIGR